MKKLFYFLVLIPVALVSCDSQVSSLDGPENVGTNGDLELIENLKNFNEELLTSRPQTRGRFWKILNVSIADLSGGALGFKDGGSVGAIFGPTGAAIGSGIGAIIGGAACSYITWRDTHASNGGNYLPMYNTEQIFNNQMLIYEAKESITPAQMENIRIQAGVNISFPDNFDMEEIGIAHNAIIYNLSNPVRPAIIGQPEAIRRLEKQIVSSREFKIAYQQLLQNVINSNYLVGNTNIKRFYSFYPGLSSVSSQILTNFSEICSSYVQEVNDIDMIIRSYTDIIESASSSLTNDDKEAIYSSFAIAAYSGRLWDDIFY